MIEKLLENWLDKASERSYQPVFVQMLSAQGYEVLHSTRHCLLEFGKDILAIGPDGVGCAFQLKGDPGKRMQIAEFRSGIQFQLVQLMSQAPAYPGFPAGTYRSYLVSNGQFEEEVQTAVQQMNNTSLPSKVELWSRGMLLEMCRTNAQQLWPGELSDTRALLELYMLNPRGKPPIKLLDGLLTSVVKLDALEPIGRPEFIRTASSAAWLTGLAISSFAEEQNHYAVAIAWTQCCVALIAAAEKHASGALTSIASSFELAKAALLDSLTALWDEVEGRSHLGQGDPLADLEVSGWRISVLFGLLSCLAFADEQSPILNDDRRTRLHKWLTTNSHHPELWGEGAIAQIVPWILWIRKHDATSRPDREIHELARALFALNQPDSKGALLSPYYDGDEVLTYRFGLQQNPFDELETFAGRAHTAEVVIHLLVRTNLKQACKSLWPDFTRLNHHRFHVESATGYCRFRSLKGVEETKVYPPEYSWSELKEDALGGTEQHKVPTALAKNPWLLGMWWQAAPHRLNADSVRLFSDEVLPGWGS
ncbi:hypothetical protein LJR066_000607 [Acidovorax sp. LjRoot66]|uniref:hypothetical protein n=1 Tax=Acidovorax sp. LjRoot66 TaxID=3342334 RepID=UPI003ECE7646